MTGEMSRADVTREAFPLHFAIADAFGGTVEPFDVYQGPFVATAGARLWIVDDAGGFSRIFNETTRAQSEAFSWEPADAVEAARTVLPETRSDKATRALALLREARDLLTAAGAVRTVAKLRPVISSADGAVRAARMRDNRL